MFFIPFPFIIAEVMIFILASKEWGFLKVLGWYFIPCLLGLFIVSSMRRFAFMNLQASMMQGQMPAQAMLSSALFFLSGILFLIPSFFSRVIALFLFLPGLRHLVVWRIRKTMEKKIAAGKASSFGFGNFGFGGAGGPTGGFRYYDFRSTSGPSAERDVTNNDVLDVTPLEIVHQKKSESADSDDSNR